MAKPDILQMGPYPVWDQEALDEAFVMHKVFEASDSDAFISQVGPSIRGIATRGDLGASRAVIMACPKLEIVSVYGVGFDAVDLDACREKAVRVTNTPDVLTKDVADFGIAMMLGQMRGIIGGEAWVRSGDWISKRDFALQRRAWGRKAGILGLGRIGYEVGRRLAGFDMDIAYCDVGPKEFASDWTYIADPVALAQHADVLFVTLAASSATRHIVNQAVIEAVGPDGMIVNISRASNIDEASLIAALKSGKLGSAALDVFDGEPRINPEFLECDNIMLQPHQASGTVETRKDMGQLMRQNLIAHFAGRDLLTPVL